jgi:hypothetical protein
MPSVTCNINNFLFAVIVILIITFTDNLFNSIPILKKLFTDSLNYILLIILVILVILVDMPSGIMLAFTVLYLSVYIKYHKKKVSFANVNNSGNLSESEFIYNNIKPFPNGNLMPFQQVNQEDINKIALDNQASSSGCGIKLQDPEFITTVGSPSRDGYDVNGCRYDFKNSPQNLTNYGPPLAQCATYSGEQARICGTVFYPLNG